MSEPSPQFPLNCLYLYLADRCNLSCGHCWISPGSVRDPNDELPAEILIKTVAEAGTLGLQSVKLTGGEPFLYRDIRPLLAFLASEGIDVIVETNGTLLDQDLIERLRLCKTAQISVSLDAGRAEVHDGLRGVRGCFDRTIAGLRLLAENGLGFQVIMTLYRRNREEIPALISLCRELGASSLKINPMLPCGRGQDRFRENENLDPPELIRLYRRVEKEWSFPKGLEIIFDLPAAFRSIEDIKARGIVECRILNILGILANGDLSLCGIGQTSSELRMGNIRRHSIREVWENDPVLADLRAGLPGRLQGICGRCLFRFQCLGSCRANAYAVDRDLFAPYFLCREAHEAGLFPLSRIDNDERPS